MSQSRIAVSLALIGVLTACQPAKQELNGLSAPERRLFEQASEKRASGNISDAIRLYTQAAKLSSGSVEAHVAIAELLRKENSADQALDMLENALLMQPGDARLHMEMGFALVAQSKHNEAIQRFNKALQLDAELGSAYSGKAVAYDLQGKHSTAQAIYSEAKARGFGTPALDNNYALSLIFTSHYDEAIALLEPHASSTYATKTMKQNLALAYGLKGDVGRAAHYGDEGLDPIAAKNNLAFYKRFTALKQGEATPRTIAIGATSDASKAVPVSPVEHGDIGFLTGDGRTNQVILRPNIEVMEIDAEAFEAMME